MSKFVCPECGADGQFVETFSQSFEVTGKFNEVGEIEGQDPDLTDSTTEGFICLTCQEEFDEPKEVDADEDDEDEIEDRVDRRGLREIKG